MTNKEKAEAMYKAIQDKKASNAILAAKDLKKYTAKHISRVRRVKEWYKQ